MAVLGLLDPESEGTMML